MGEIKISDLSEIKTPEIKTPENQGFKEIQPQEGMIPQEANKFWDNELSELNVHEITGGPYLDDNGKEYRRGDDLIPNNEFEINGYKYKTDSEGRVISAEGKLRRSQEHKRNMEKMDVVSKGDKMKGDEIGHLIAKMFGGSDKLENLVPMSKELNRSDYKKMENELKSAVDDGKDVRLKVEPIYDGDSHRPTEIRATYTIDGDTTVRVFRNEGGGSI